MNMANYVPGLRLGRLAGILACGLLMAGHLTVQARDGALTSGAEKLGHVAFGDGTSLLEPGVVTAFQFDGTTVMCSVGRAVMADGTVLQMFMVSEHVDSVTIDLEDKTVIITGSMVSYTKLHFANGTTAKLWETVPFTAYGADRGGVGKDFFSLTVAFSDTPALDQFDLFGSPATFAGTLTSGMVEVR